MLNQREVLFMDFNNNFIGKFGKGMILFLFFKLVLIC